MVKSTKQLQDFGSQAESVGMRLSAAITLPIAAVGGAALVAAGKMEQTQVAFTTLLKSADAAKSHIEEMKKFTLITPYQFEDVTKMSRLMQAMGTDVRDVIPHLRTFGNAVSAMGGGPDVLERVVRSMSEIGTRGKITGEQLRELSRAGIPALQALAEKMGVSVAEAQDRVTKGMVDAKTATEALLDYMNKKFGGGMEAMSQTMLGMVSNLKDRMTFTLAAIGTALLPLAKDLIANYIDPLLEKVQDLAEVFSKLPKPVQTATLGVGGFAAVLPPLIWATGTLITNASVIAGAFAKLGGGAALLSAALSPITIVIGSILALTPSMISFWKGLRQEWENDQFLSTIRGHFVQMEQAMAANLERLRPLAPAFALVAGGIKLNAEATEALTKLNIKSTAARESDLKAAKEAYEVLKRSGEGHQVLSEAALRVQQAEEALNGTLAKVTEKFQQIPRVTLESAVNTELYSRAISRQDGLLKEIVEYRLTAFTKLWHSFIGDGPVVISTFDALAKSIDSADKLVAKMGEDIASLSGASLSASPFGALAESAQYFGITTASEFDEIARKSQEMYDRMLSSGVATYRDLTVAGLKKDKAIADADLANQRIDKATHDARIQQADAELAKITTVTGKIVRDRYNLAAEVINASHRMFDGLERDLASNVVQWKGWSDTIKKLWQGLATDLLQIMLKVALKPLEDAFARLMGGIFGGSAQAGGGVLGTTVGAAGGAAGTIAGGVSSAGGVATKTAGSAVSGVMGTIGAVSAAVGAISSIVGNFQMAGMNKSLDLIENYTRYLKIGLVEQGDSLLNDSHVIRNTLTDFMSWNWHVATTYFQAISSNLDQIAGNGGAGNTYNFDFRGANFGGASQSSLNQMMTQAFLQAKAAQG